MNHIYTIRELPKHYFNGVYTIFCFEVHNNQPLALHIGYTFDDIITIKDLDKLDGYFEGDHFYEDKHSYNLFIEFLKSITVGIGILPVHYDLEYVKNHFYVNVKTL